MFIREGRLRLVVGVQELPLVVVGCGDTFLEPQSGKGRR